MLMRRVKSRGSGHYLDLLNLRVIEVDSCALERPLHLGRQQHVTRINKRGIAGLRTIGACASAFRTPRRMPTVISGSSINKYLGAKVRTKLVHRFGCSETTTHCHPYLGAVAVGDVDVVQHRDSTSNLTRTEDSGRAF